MKLKSCPVCNGNGCEFCEFAGKLYHVKNSRLHLHQQLEEAISETLPGDSVAAKFTSILIAELHKELEALTRSVDETL